MSKFWFIGAVYSSYLSMKEEQCLERPSSPGYEPGSHAFDVPAVLENLLFKQYHNLYNRSND